MVLNNAELKMLVDKLHAGEMRAILQHRYDKPEARKDDIYWCNQAYQESITLLGEEPNHNLPEDELATLQQKVWDAARSSISFSYEALKNLKLRAEYLGIMGHITRAQEAAIFKINQIKNEEEAIPYKTEEQLAGSAQRLRDVVEENVQTMNKLYGAWANQSSPVWKAMLQWKELPFLQALEREKALCVNLKISSPKVDIARSLNMPVSETKLSDTNDLIKTNLKIQIDILRDARSDISINNVNLLSSMRTVGGVLFIFTLGAMIWVIKESQNPAIQTIKSILSLGASLAGGYAGTIGGGMLGSIGGPPGIVIGGVLGGIICSFISGVAADSLFDALLMAFTTPQSDVLMGSLFGKPILYELQLPDNMTLSMEMTKSLTGKL